MPPQRACHRTGGTAEPARRPRPPVTLGRRAGPSPHRPGPTSSGVPACGASRAWGVRRHVRPARHCRRAYCRHCRRPRRGAEPPRPPRAPPFIRSSCAREPPLCRRRRGPPRTLERPCAWRGGDGPSRCSRQPPRWATRRQGSKGGARHLPARATPSLTMSRWRSRPRTSGRASKRESGRPAASPDRPAHLRRRGSIERNRRRLARRRRALRTACTPAVARARFPAIATTGAALFEPHRVSSPPTHVSRRCLHHHSTSGPACG